MGSIDKEIYKKIMHKRLRPKVEVKMLWHAFPLKV